MMKQYYDILRNFRILVKVVPDTGNLCRQLQHRHSLEARRHIQSVASISKSIFCTLDTQKSARRDRDRAKNGIDPSSIKTVSRYFPTLILVRMSWSISSFYAGPHRGANADHRRRLAGPGQRALPGDQAGAQRQERGGHARPSRTDQARRRLLRRVGTPHAPSLHRQGPPCQESAQGNSVLTHI